jgi:hypothetical protein
MLTTGRTNSAADTKSCYVTTSCQNLNTGFVHVDAGYRNYPKISVFTREYININANSYKKYISLYSERNTGIEICPGFPRREPGGAQVYA